MRRLGQFTIIFALLAALLAACAGAAAPAAEAPAAEEAAAAAQESAASDIEMPQPDPADQAQEATVEPGGAATIESPLNVENVPAVRTFQLVPGASTMQYFVEEEFFGQAVPFITAVGQTTALTGAVTLRFVDDGVTIDNSVFTADISTLTSDRPRRDQAIRERWLESSRFPLATFVATEVAALPAGAAFGQDVRFQVQGDMTIRDVTNPLTWQMTARIDGGLLTGAATTFFTMRDYGFDPPDVAGILRVTDGVTVTVNFVAEENDE